MIKKALSLLVFFSWCILLFSQKTDVLILVNDDAITGEIKKLEHGILTYKTDDAGTLQVKWEQVGRLQSVNLFEIENYRGEVFFGSMEPTREFGKIKIASDTVSAYVASIPDIVRITPIRLRFWNRLNGGISLGFSYTKASNIAQLNYNLNTTYRTRKISNEVNLSGNTTYGIRQDEELENAVREDFTNIFTRYLTNKWYAGAIVAVQRNTEMGLDRRLLVGAGGGNHLIQTNRHELGLLLGLVGLREWLSGEDPTQTHLEGLFSVTYSLFKHDSPKSNITFNGNFFPGITDWGRIRANINLSAQQEIISDFFIAVSFYESYDSNPGEEAAKNDWGIVTSVGYSW